MAVGVLAVVTGVLVAVLPYDTTPVDGGVRVRCERPITGALGDDADAVAAPPGTTVTVACPESARERLALSALVAVAGAAGLVAAARRHLARRASGG